MAPDTADHVEILIDCRPTNARVYEKGQAAFYVSVAMAVDPRSGFLFSVDIAPPREEDQKTVEAARNALQAVRDQMPAARITFAVRQERVGAALAAAFGDDPVTVATTCDFGPWDEAYISLDERMGSGTGVIPHLWRGDITEAEVARFHAAAARFYRARPWRLLSDLDPVELPDPTPSRGQTMVTVVMGSSGIARGVALFRSMRDYQTTMAGEQPRTTTFVSFERLAKIPHTLAAEAEEHGWTVVNKSAFPALTTSGGAKLSGANGDEVRRATAALELIASAVEFGRIMTDRKHAAREIYGPPEEE